MNYEGVDDKPKNEKEDDYWDVNISKPLGIITTLTEDEVRRKYEKKYKDEEKKKRGKEKKDNFEDALLQMLLSFIIETACISLTCIAVVTAITGMTMEEFSQLASLAEEEMYKIIENSEDKEIEELFSQLIEKVREKYLEMKK